jgi:hypothetical protein
MEDLAAMPMGIGSTVLAPLTKTIATSSLFFSIEFSIPYPRRFAQILWDMNL